MTLNEFEQYCLDTAQSFTAVRGFGAKRTKEAFDTLDAAYAYAATFADGRTMIYAVSGVEGCAAHLCNK